MIVEKTQLLINHSWTFINILEVLDLHGRCLQCSCPDSGVGKNSNSPLTSFATAWYTKYILFRCWEPKGGLLQQFLGGGNSNIFLFSPLPGEMIQFDEHFFQMGWFNHQLDLFRSDSITVPNKNHMFMLCKFVNAKYGHEP